MILNCTPEVLQAIDSSGKKKKKKKNEKKKPPTIYLLKVINEARLLTSSFRNKDDP